MKCVKWIWVGVCFSVCVSCSPEAARQYLKPNPPVQKVAEDPHVELRDPAVDILFVVDDSGSMSEHQANVASNIKEFTAELQKAGNIDFRLAVVTTTNRDSDSNKVACCGKFVGQVPVVSRNTPNFNLEIEKNILVGTRGDWEEKSFDPVVAALSSPLLENENAGFLRDEAYLAVVFVTDAEDQSVASADELYNFLLKVKNGRIGSVLSYGAIIPSGDTLNCQRDNWNDAPKRIEDFLSKVVNSGKNVLNLCSANFGQELIAIATEISSYVAHTVFLSRRPDIRSLRVTYGQMEIPWHPHFGFVYDSTRNALVFGTEIDWRSQPSGSKIAVYYNAADEPDAPQRP